jgi:hypothetical protein
MQILLSLFFFLADWLLALLRFCHLDVGMWLCWEGEQRFYQLFDCLGRSRRAANRLPMQVSELRLITSLLAASRAGIPDPTDPHYVISFGAH